VVEGAAARKRTTENSILLGPWVNKGMKRGLEPLRAPPYRSRIDQFQLATLLRLGQLVPDIVLDPSSARRPLLLGAAALRAVLPPLPCPAASVSSSRTLSLIPPEPGRWLSSVILPSFLVVGLTALLLSTHLVGADF
jgi:hypothetical protein